MLLIKALALIAPRRIAADSLREREYPLPKMGRSASCSSVSAAPASELTILPDLVKLLQTMP